MSETVNIIGVKLAKLKTYADDRGFFREVIRIPELESSMGIGQISHSEVFPGVLKAWHGHKQQYQWTYVASGTILMALVDSRSSSTSMNQSISLIVGENSDVNIYGFPAGVLHGYKNVGEKAQVIYMTSSTYDPNEEIRYDPYDKTIPFNWLDACKPR